MDYVEAVFVRSRRWSIQGDSRGPCEICAEYHERVRKDKRCEACVPALDQENVLAAHIWSLVLNQRIAGFGGTYDVDFKTLYLLLEKFGLSDDVGLFQRLISACRLWYRLETAESEKAKDHGAKIRRGVR